MLTCINDVGGWVVEGGVGCVAEWTQSSESVGGRNRPEADKWWRTENRKVLPEHREEQRYAKNGRGGLRSKCVCHCIVEIHRRSTMTILLWPLLTNHTIIQSHISLYAERTACGHSYCRFPHVHRFLKTLIFLCFWAQISTSVLNTFN